MKTDEQETIVNIARSGTTANVYTSDTRYQNKLNRLCEKNPDVWKRVKEYRTQEGELTGVEYECPARLISFRGKMMHRNAGIGQQMATTSGLETQ